MRGHCFNKVRQTACILDRPRHDRPVEVRAESYPVFTEAIKQIREMVYHRLKRCIFVEMSVGTHVTHTEIEAYHPIRVSDRIELSIREIAC